MEAGLYLVTLLNDDPIPVNAQDERRAQVCIRANRFNCKLGVTTRLRGRHKDYDRTFGSHNVVFRVLALLSKSDLADAERAVLRKVDQHRVRGATGRRNEWLMEIDPQEARKLAIHALQEAKIEFVLEGEVSCAE